MSPRSRLLQVLEAVAPRRTTPPGPATRHSTARSPRIDSAPTAQKAPTHHPRVIGHRGASGYRPEHTREAYRLAAGQGAHSIEPDLVMTADRVLVARHENELSRSTDVAARPEFAGHRCTRLVEGREVTGWFTEDFTLAELRRLSVRERHPRVRPANTYWDDKGHGILTFEEVLDLAETLRLSVHAEIKHAAHFHGLGLDPVPVLSRTLHTRAARGDQAPLTLMSFEPTVLQAVHGLGAPLVQLVDHRGRPADLRDTADSIRFRDMVTPAGLDRVAEYAHGIGVHKNLVLPRTEDDRLGSPSKVVRRAHHRGLDVLVWTLRAENKYLPAEARIGALPSTYGTLDVEVAALAAAGVDALLTDHPDLVTEALARL